MERYGAPRFFAVKGIRTLRGSFDTIWGYKRCSMKIPGATGPLYVLFSMGTYRFSIETPKGLVQLGDTI